MRSMAFSRYPYGLLVDQLEGLVHFVFRHFKALEIDAVELLRVLRDGRIAVRLHVVGNALRRFPGGVDASSSLEDLFERAGGGKLPDHRFTSLMLA
jgi:hypothetical protein